MTDLRDLKCVITGSFGFKDIGDEAMLTEDLHFLVHECGLSRDNIVLFGALPDYVSSYHEHPRACCLSSRAAVGNAERLQFRKHSMRARVGEFARLLAKKKLLPGWNKEVDGAIAGADFALVTGGGTINTRSPDGQSLHRMHAMVSYFRDRGLPIFMSGQTIGPLGLYPAHDAAAKSIVESVEVLTVRDSRYSRRYLDAIEANPAKFLETFDDAYCLPYEEAELPDDLLAFLQEGEVMTICVTDYTCDTYEKRAYLAELTEKLLDEQCGRVVFVSHTPMDLQALYQIYDMLGNAYKERVRVPDDRLWTGSQLKRLISHSKVAIGGRYHFIVFAGSSDTPFVGMTGNHYSYVKQDGFARPLGLEDYILTEKETWDLATVLERVEQASRLKLQNKNRFSRPSDSMKLLREWLGERFPS